MRLMCGPVVSLPQSIIFAVEGVVEAIKFAGERIDRLSFLPPQVITLVVLSGALPKLLVGPDASGNKLQTIQTKG